MSEEFFKFNKAINDRIMNNDTDQYTYENKYNFLAPYINIFDINKDGIIKPNEIRTIWQNIYQECTEQGDELIINKDSVREILDNYDKDKKLNATIFVRAIKSLFPFNSNEREGRGIQLKRQKINDYIIEYYQNGVIKNKREPKFGRPAGDGTEYYASGRIFRQYTNRGTSYITYYQSGKIAEENIDGYYTSYYENGQIKKDKNDIQYYPDGKILQKDGKYYDTFGNLIKNKTLEGKTFGNLTKDKTYDDKIFELADNIKLILKGESFDTKHITEIINKDNIIEIIRAYRIKCNSNIFKDIEEFVKNKDLKDELTKYLETSLEERYYENLNNIPKISKIKNTNYEGDEYKVKWKDKKIYIKNKNSKQETIIDTQQIIKDLPKNEQYLILITLQNLPAEVLIDFGNEVSFGTREIGYGIGGLYEIPNDLISLRGGGLYNEGIIVHELGHAFDHIFEKNNCSSNLNDELESTFKEEQLSAVMILPAGEFNLKNYASTSLGEFFAECYAFLMLGDEYKAKECIEKNFPRSLAIVKEIIRETRQLPPGVRHRQDLK